MTQTPSVGRIVHYQSYGTPGGEYLPEPRAAIITAVGSVKVLGDGEHIGDVTHVSLAVLNPNGMFFNQGVLYSEKPKPGCWNWPPRA